MFSFLKNAKDWTKMFSLSKCSVFHHGQKSEQRFSVFGFWAMLENWTNLFKKWTNLYTHSIFQLMSNIEHFFKHWTNMFTLSTLAQRLNKFVQFLRSFNLSSNTEQICLISQVQQKYEHFLKTEQILSVFHWFNKDLTNLFSF